MLVVRHASFAQSAPPTGNGPYAAPLAAAYADLTNAATKIVTDNHLNGARTVIYDPQTFSSLSSYQAAVEQLRLAMTKLCLPPAGGVVLPLIAVTADIGGAASGLAALLAAITPTYAIQGQSVSFDNTALIAAFAHVAGDAVIFPGYLPPAAKHRDDLLCGQQDSSSSVVDLWYGALKAASDLAAKAASSAAADKPILQAKVDAFQKVADSFVAIDKGPSMLSKLLVVESLLRQVPDKTSVHVIDLRLDAAGIDTKTRTILFWKSTKFNSTVMAHYTLLRLCKDGNEIDVQRVTTDNVTILSKVKNHDKFATSVAPAGTINGPHSGNQ